MKCGHRLALALAGALLLAVVFASVPGSTRWMRTLHDSAHGPVFGCIAVLMLFILRARPRFGAMPARIQYLIALLGAASLGAASELAQMPTGRDASLVDLGHDVLGALAFLAIFSAFDSRLNREGKPRRATRAGIVLVGVSALGILAAPMGRALMEYQRRDASFPVIADFTSRYDRYFVGRRGVLIESAVMPPAWAERTHESAMRVHFLPAPYPGIDLFELSPDWRKYSALVMDLTNPTQVPLELSLLVMDAHHDYALEDRYSTALQLPPATRRRIRIPMEDIEAGPPGRSIDLANMAGIVMFRTRHSQADEMYVSRVWLEGLPVGGGSQTGEAQAGLQN
jgi:hypothetical protein